MMKRTHIAVGVAIAVPIILNFDLPKLSALGLIATIFPDWDFYMGIEHRTLTHSLTLLLATSIPIYLYNPSLGLIWGLCYLSHILLDSLTVMGVPFLYPLIKKRNSFMKFRTGKGEDYFIQLIAIYFTTMNFI